MNNKLQLATKVAISIGAVIILIYLITLRDWTAIAALAALGAALAVVYQTYIYRFSIGADLMLKLDERFEGDEFRQKRRVAGGALRAQDKNNKKDIEDVLDFFETLSLLVRRKALDKELVWNTFFYIFYGYCLYGKAHIEAEVREYPTRYQDLLWLQKELVAVETHKNGTLDESEWSNFLDEEEGK